MSSTAEALERIRAVDSAGQLDDVLALPDHLADALWRVESARLERFECSGIVVCGMGGSAIGADLAKAAVGDRLTRPLLTVRGYDPPSSLPADHAFLCSSYSGNTEETLACYAAAEALGARRFAATTGGELADAARRDGVPVIGIPSGLQPRAAVGYMFTAAVEIAALGGACDGLHTEIDTAAARLAENRDALVRRSAEVAGQLEGTIPVVFGAELTAPVAVRWKTQINENAKAPAYAQELPEADHNEIVAWSKAGPAPLSAVFLTDCDQHPRLRARFAVTADLMAPAASAVVSIETEGATPTERLLRAVMLGDLVSLQLAAQRGVDPTPVDVITALKSELAKLDG